MGLLFYFSIMILRNIIISSLNLYGVFEEVIYLRTLSSSFTAYLIVPFVLRTFDFVRASPNENKD